MDETPISIEDPTAKVLPVPEAPEGTGTFDHNAGPEQMKAIRAALVAYFGADDWLDARRRGQAA